MRIHADHVDVWNDRVTETLREIRTVRDTPNTEGWLEFPGQLDVIESCLRIVGTVLEDIGNDVQNKEDNS